MNIAMRGILAFSVQANIAIPSLRIFSSVRMK